MKSLEDIEVHQSKRKLRELLTEAIRGLAKHHRGRDQQTLMDASCNMEPGPIDESRLPIRPDGFFLKQHTVLQHKGIRKRTLIEFQLVSMAVMYYWLYCHLRDRQDLRSCMRYCGFITGIVEDYKSYYVAGDVRHGWYLSNAKKDPKPPGWLEAEEGETV